MMVKIKFSNENIVDALIGALEGGSNYWYFLPDVSMVKKIDNKSLSECIVLSALSGIEIPVYDVEAEDIFLGNISKQNIRRGIKLYIKNGRSFDVENMDAINMDILFQYVVMGDIVFG